uniref:Uncharacterized protein n=1 Tax=Glossina austeni TaxID=7395 RepID=A0A1A9UMY6_GLOAU
MYVIVAVLSFADTSGSHEHKIDVCTMLHLQGCMENRRTFANLPSIAIHELLKADENCVANSDACRGLKENIEKELSAWREEDSRIIVNLRKQKQEKEEEEKLFRTEEVKLVLREQALTDYEWDFLAIVKSPGISIGCCNKALAAFHRIKHGLEGEQRGTKAANVHKHNHLVSNVFKILVPKRENNSLVQGSGPIPQRRRIVLVLEMNIT